MRRGSGEARGSRKSGRRRDGVPADFSGESPGRAPDRAQCAAVPPLSLRSDLRGAGAVRRASGGAAAGVRTRERGGPGGYRRRSGSSP